LMRGLRGIKKWGQVKLWDWIFCTLHQNPTPKVKNHSLLIQ